MKEIKGQVEIDYGMDNFCYIHTRNGRRVDLTECSYFENLQMSNSGKVGK